MSWKQDDFQEAAVRPVLTGRDCLLSGLVCGQFALAGLLGHPSVIRETKKDYIIC